MITEQMNKNKTANKSSTSNMENETVQFEKDVAATEKWFTSDRFQDITRLYSERQVVEQRGTIQQDYTVARTAAEGFYHRLQELFTQGQSITTYGPYTPGQAVAMKRMGIEGIYLGGWATSAKGSITEDPGPDLAGYPLSQVPDEAAPVVRALLAADKNQRFYRTRMSEKDRAASMNVDYRPFIIADADTGHGGDAHTRNLIRRFVEVGVPGYHIEDQKPGVKKCGHQGGKVLVPQDEQNKRLNAARYQLDIMRVPGIIVARTDAESATLLDGCGDERDQPFILGVTNMDVPSYKNAYLSLLKQFYDSGISEINGHLLYEISQADYDACLAWFDQIKLAPCITESIESYQQGREASVDKALDKAATAFVETWEKASGITTFRLAVADLMVFHMKEGREFDMSVDQWHAFAKTTSLRDARDKTKTMGIDVVWDCELSRTPEGYYQVQGGIDYAIAKSLAAAPFADLLWMETKTADLADAKTYADTIHAVYPNQMLAYNLSPSFNWDTTGMNDDQMRQFPKELGKLGFVFNFITYGGHQIDGLASEEFSAALMEDGMLALARLQRKFRLLNSSYKTPQSHVGGPRLDGALMATSGRTATTKAMGKGSTQFQHLVQTEVPIALLEQWLGIWVKHNKLSQALQVGLRPHKSGSDLLELTVTSDDGTKVANIIFASIQDRRGRTILSIRDQNTFDKAFRQKRLVTLMHLFLIKRYKAFSVHYVSPTEDNQKQSERMKELGIYDDVNTEVGHIIVAGVDSKQVNALLDADSALEKLIAKNI